MLSIFFSPVTDDRLSAGVDVNVFKRDFLRPPRRINPHRERSMQAPQSPLAGLK
jgi:hypothetical protein